MSEFLVAYKELMGDPTSAVALLQLHQIMTGAPAVEGLDDAKETVKSMAETLAAALADEP